MEEQESSDRGSTLSTNEILLKSVLTSEVSCNIVPIVNKTLICYDMSFQVNSTDEINVDLHLSTGQIDESLWITVSDLLSNIC